MHNTQGIIPPLGEVRRGLLLSAFFLFSGAAVMAQTDVQSYKPGVTTEGITYCLPRTALRVVVKATRTDVTPGSLHAYAQRYLSLSDVPTEASTTWTLDAVEVQPYGVPDPSKFFTIALKSKTIAPLVSLAEDGRLLSIHTEVDEQPLPPVPQGVEGKNTVNPRDYMNRDMLTVGSAAKQAELVAQEIYDIRDSRSALARGEADNTPKDGAQLKLMFDMLQQQEDALLSLFRGTTVTSTVVRTIDFIPEKGERSILFRFSRHLGMVEADDLSGAPVYITITPQNDLPAPEQSPEADKKKAKIADKSVRFNVTNRTRVTIGTAARQYANFDTPMAQFGYVELLGPALFDKNTTTTLVLNPATGGIVELTEGKGE